MLPHWILTAAAPLRRIDRRMPAIERALGLEIGKGEFGAIVDACREDGLAFGAYVHWYLQKWLIARQVRSMRQDRVRALVKALDETDYGALGNLDSDRGCLICIPHHDHYILSIVALVEHLVRSRATFVFYASPERRSGNRVFDSLHECLHGAGSHAAVVHDTPTGMARVMRALREGAAVLLMPDAVRDPISALHVPFFERALPVQLGAASLARRTRAQLIAAICRPGRRALSFRTSICEPVEGTLTSIRARSDKHALQLDDYRVMRALFAQFEREMRGSVSRWQHVRSHFANKTPFPAVGTGQLTQASEVVFSDPRLADAMATPFVID